MDRYGEINRGLNHHNGSSKLLSPEDVKALVKSLNYYATLGQEIMLNGGNGITCPEGRRFLNALRSKCQRDEMNLPTT